MSETSRKLSRRKFMAVSSAAIAAPMLMNMAGTVPDAKGSEKTYDFTDKKKCDFVVAGSGSGMVAAVRAALAGYKVIILEKTKIIGGGMLFASTMRTFGSKWQKERNLPDVTAQYARKMLDDCYWRIEPHLVENILKSALVLGNGDLVIADPVLRGEKLPDTTEECHNDIEKALATQKNCFRADTLEELSDILGIHKTGLLETISDYNRYCEEGFDWGFYKPASTLIPFTEGPYYAVSGFMATDGAFGGVKVDPDMQAYARDGGLVEGLYVTGDFASGRHINLEGVKRQFINDMNWSLAGSYIDGDRVIGYLASL